MKKYKYITFPLLFIFAFIIFFVIYKNFSKPKQATLSPATIKSFDINVAFDQLCKDYPRMYNKSNFVPISTIVISSMYGFVATDGYSVTHKYDENSKKFIPLIPAGPYDKNSKTKILNVLNRLIGMKTTLIVNKKNVVTTNPTKINRSDIDSYSKSNTDANSKSFKFIYNSKKEPVLIVAVNTIPKKEVETALKNLQKAVNVLEQYDSKMLSKISTEYFLRVITGPISGDKIAANRTVTIPSLGAIQYNTRLIGDDYIFYVYSLVSQARYIGNYKSSMIKTDNVYTYYLADNLDPVPSMDQLLWTKKWVASHKNDIFKDGYNDYINMIDILIKK